MVATNYKNAFKEVYVILDSLVEEDYKKIPPELIETIYRNMNQDYKYELDEEQKQFYLIYLEIIYQQKNKSKK